MVKTCGSGDLILFFKIKKMIYVLFCSFKTHSLSLCLSQTNSSLLNEPAHTVIDLIIPGLLARHHVSIKGIAVKCSPHAWKFWPICVNIVTLANVSLLK